MFLVNRCWDLAHETTLKRPVPDQRALKAKPSHFLGGGGGGGAGWRGGGAGRPGGM
jgi:hypothetical protein